MNNEINKKIEQAQKESLDYLSAKNKRQFVVMARRHEQMPFMEEADVPIFNEAIKKAEDVNLLSMLISYTVCTVSYKFFGGFAPLPAGQSVWLRRLRHLTAISVPGLILPTVYTAFFPPKSLQEIGRLAKKYEAQTEDPVLIAKLEELRKNNKNQDFSKKPSQPTEKESK